MPSDANLIIPRIWIGNYRSAHQPEFLTKHKITVIINCTKDIPFINLPSISYRYRVPVHDNLQIEEIKGMGKYLLKIVPVIRYHYLKKRNILVHCAAGMQRSAIVVLAYLATWHYASDNSYRLIKRQRPITFTPSMNFEESLYYYLLKSKQK